MGKRPRPARAAEGGRSGADEGRGSEGGVRPGIFEPFVTTKREGTGLGLATVQRIVDAHGGTVEVESAPGRGAAFTIRMPAAAPAAGGEPWPRS